MYVDLDTVDMQLKSGPHPLYRFYSSHMLCPLQAVVYTGSLQGALVWSDILYLCIGPLFDIWLG
jgi:hypothetical protein